MKKNLDMDKLIGCDSEIKPSDELNRQVICKMEHGFYEMTADTVTNKNEKISMRRYTIFRRAALICSLIVGTVMLMSAGIKVYEYIAFIPGSGVVTIENDDVYTLASAVKLGSYYIEGASIVPDEGGYKITVITNMTGRAENHEIITISDSSGSRYELTFSRGSDSDSLFTGTVEKNDDMIYTVTRGSGQSDTAELSFIPLSGSMYAKYSYPVSDCITFVAFPLAENSNQFVYDVIFEPQSEEMKAWADYADEIHAFPVNVKVTDVNGNEYSPHTFRSGSADKTVDVKKSSEKYSGKMDFVNRMVFSERFDYPIEKISISAIEMKFRNKYDISSEQTEPLSVTLFVPDTGKCEKINTVLTDFGGIKVTADRILRRIPEESSMETLCVLGNNLTSSMPENVIFGTMWYRFDFGDGYQRNHGMYNIRDTAGIHNYVAGETIIQQRYYDEFAEEGYQYQIGYTTNLFVNESNLKDDNLPIIPEAGTEFKMIPYELSLIIGGDWTINCTD